MNDRSSEASTHGNLAVAYQALGMHEMALVHYHGHLNIARELKDSACEALALCNLGSCHAARSEFSQVRENHVGIKAIICTKLRYNW